ncbi:A/G-specific adenine glycosylase [Paracrocinitomix mangrovi]|uniref:A/G-specific adenine glycosylase n=1 Tax=Paracrocinitomix mangrovi TaxID=2862509 RepID=UPI001C8D1EFE|nr:A/G-specific adenine glycosylase [Paracrocinitomix mangrovi]UKN03819.1 A/G-specific adenine glycosylase [Paracrocinitomix mangrovi]
MQDFTTLIQNWYRQNRRDLPWRNTCDPYFIWLSEIILQQTRVEQGMSYYLKFVEHYPTVKHLANAAEDEVLNLWQGLGYYSRARNLHAAAQYIHQHNQNQFPDTYKGVLSLKGVGEYTAAAICSFAYDLPHAVVDGNVYRVLSRYLNIDTPIDSTEGKKIFKEAAEELLDKNDPATHNQAIMELGALVCKPSNPDCDNCPLNESCAALEKGVQLQLPVKSKKVKVKKRFFHYQLITDGEHLLIKKRGPKDIWHGLYDFPLIEKDKQNEQLSSADINADEKGISLDGELKHILTHQVITASFWIVEVDKMPALDGCIRIKIKELDDYPMPQLLIRYLESSTLFKAD